MVSGIEIKVIKSVDEVGKEALDTLSDDPFFTYGWFKTVENQQTLNVEPLYLAVYEEGKLFAFAPFFIEPIVPKGLVSKLIKVVRLFGYSEKSLNCYSPRCYRSKILFSHQGKEKLVLSLICKHLDLICKQKKILKSSFHNASEFDNSMFDSLGNYGYLKTPGIDTLYLDVYWRSFDDYIQDLKGKARGKIKREIRKCSENGIIIRESELTGLTTKLSDLYENLSLKYDKNAIRIFNAHFFDNINRYSKDKVKMFTAWKNDELVGFCLCLHQKDVMDVFMVGFNYNVQTKTDFSYFNITYYAPIKWGIDYGIKKIYYRLMMDKIKIERGCKVEKNFFYVKYHMGFVDATYRFAMNNYLVIRLRNWLDKLVLSRI